MRWTGIACLLAFAVPAEAAGQGPPPPPPAPNQPPVSAAPAPPAPRSAQLLRARFEVEVVEARNRIAAHLRGLQTSEVVIEGDERDAEIWDEAVYGGKDDFYNWFSEVPEFHALVDFATRALAVEGRPIIEKAHRAANRRWGKATCDGGAPLLLYGIDRADRVSPMAYAFFREHEYAHFVLKHSACPLTGPGPGDAAQRARELAADCWAARQLMAQGSWGQMVVGVAIDRLAQLDQKESGTHPSSRARVQNLMQCKPERRDQ